MLKFVARRLAVSSVVLLCATALMYFLTAASGDPLRDLYDLPEPNRSNQIAARTAALRLDLPVPVRYWTWLTEVGRCLLPPYGDGSCTLGHDRNGLAVFPQLAPALEVSLRLVLLSVFIAVGMGLLVGVLAAVRQHSAFDHTVALLSFIGFSMPVFWVSTLVKTFLAIRFNDWLARPVTTVLALVIIGALAGLVWSVVIGGSRRTRLVSFLVATVVIGGGLFLLIDRGWFTAPGLGVYGVAATAAGAAVGICALLAGVKDRRVLAAAGGTAALGVVSYLVLSGVRLDLTAGALAGLFLLTVVVSGGLGVALGGFRRRLTAVVCVATGIVTALAICVDFTLRSYPGFFEYKRGRPIATSGTSTPNLDANLSGDLWTTVLDIGTHLVLPTVVLVSVPLAVYARYTRASVLEVLDQEHVRTALAKGLTTRTVMLRHVLRNALVPIVTLVAFDFAAVIGGSVVVENLFGWTGGMGQFFTNSVSNLDLNPVMAFFLMAGAATFVFNLLADIAYAFLDPRVVVS